jgi:hypothetical protein
MARSAFDASDFVSILGQHFVKHERQTLLNIPGSSVSYDRVTLGRLGCPHPAAALRLNRVFQELRIRTLEGLAREIHTIGNFKGLGVTAYFVVLAILREHGYDAEKLHGEDVTVSTLKSRANKASRKRATKRPRRAGPPSEAADAGA